MDIFKCEKCGGEMKKLQEGSTQGFFCGSCGWSVVTTYIDPIRQDHTEYAVFADVSNTLKANQLKVLNKITGQNLLQIKKSLQQEKQLVYRGSATEVYAVLCALKSCEIVCEVKPAFPYDVE